MEFYQFARGVVKTVLFPFYRVKVVGRENFPKEGGVLICSNHISNLDPPVVGIASPRSLYFMAKEELFSVPVLKGILPKINAFPVKRGFSDRQALRTALNLLKDGKVVGLFPEGHRSKDGKLGEGFSGAGFFALRGGDAVVLPCAVIGPYKRFHPITVVFGKPIDMTPYRERRAKAEEVTAVIMSGIQQILDEYEKK